VTSAVLGRSYLVATHGSVRQSFQEQQGDVHVWLPGQRDQWVGTYGSGLYPGLVAGGWPMEIDLSNERKQGAAVPVVPADGGGHCNQPEATLYQRQRSLHLHSCPMAGCCANHTTLRASTASADENGFECVNAKMIASQIAAPACTAAQLEFHSSSGALLGVQVQF